MSTTPPTDAAGFPSIRTDNPELLPPLPAWLTWRRDAEDPRTWHAVKLQDPPTDPAGAVRFRSAVSGLWYSIPAAAGEVDAIESGGQTWFLGRTLSTKSPAADLERPIPAALFSCSYEGCAEEVPHLARDLYWLDRESRWVCSYCWENLDRDPETEDLPDRGESLEDFLLRVGACGAALLLGCD